MKEAKETHGSVNWMITYQNAHGGIEITYETTERQAVKRVDYLETLCRKPVLWRRWV